MTACISRFLPFEAIVGTLLHELVHNSIGPHRTPFKRLLAEITSECEILMCCMHPGTTVSIPTFDDCGQILGGDTEAMVAYSQRELSAYVVCPDPCMNSIV